MSELARPFEEEADVRTAIAAIIGGAFSDRLLWHEIVLSDFQKPGILPRRLEDGRIVSSLTHPAMRLATATREIDGEKVSYLVGLTERELGRMFDHGMVVIGSPGHDLRNRVVEKFATEDSEAAELEDEDMFNFRMAKLGEVDDLCHPYVLAIFDRIGDRMISADIETIDAITKMDVASLDSLLKKMQASPRMIALELDTPTAEPASPAL